MALRAASGLLVAALALVAAGCGGSTAETAATLPASATLAPADALGFVTLVADEGSAQWENADHLLDLFPDARAELLSDLQEELAGEGLSWSEDVAPALGPEVVVVVTVDRRPVVLTQPDSADALARLVDRAEDELVTGEVEGWTALAETRADLDAYRAALARGTLDTVEAFTASFERLPAEALARGWADAGALTDELQPLLEGAATEVDMGLESLGLALSAEEDGLLVTVGVRLPEGAGGSTYAPELLGRVPADAVVALSFGGTQGALERLQGSVDLDEVSKRLEDAIGVSLDGVLDALSGEGVLYLRPTADEGEVPELTLALAPPDPGEALAAVDELARSLAQQADTQVDVVTVDERELSRLSVEEVSITYGRVDDTVIVTTAADGVADLLGAGEKLADSAAFARAAERVGLGERTGGFLYVDLDGLIPLVEGLAGPDALPDEAREVLTALDAVVLEAEGDGDVTQLTGFVRTTR